MKVRLVAIPSLILVGTICAIGALLEYIVDARIFVSSFAEAPSRVLLALPEALAVSWGPIMQTLAEVGASFVLAMLIGLSLGLGLGSVRSAYQTLNGALTALYSIPKVTLLPALILWVGLGPDAVITFATLEACVPIVLVLAGAVRDFDPRLILVARAMGATQAQTQLKVVIPGLRSQFLVSVQIGLVLCFLGVILSQMFLGFGGIGGLLLNDAYQLRTAQLYAVSIIFASLVVGVLTLTRQVLGRFGAGMEPFMLAQRP